MARALVSRAHFVVRRSFVTRSFVTRSFVTRSFATHSLVATLPKSLILLGKFVFYKRSEVNSGHSRTGSRLVTSDENGEKEDSHQNYRGVVCVSRV